jgi:hypothetical protein
VIRTGGDADGSPASCSSTAPGSRVCLLASLAGFPRRGIQLLAKGNYFVLAGLALPRLVCGAGAGVLGVHLTLDRRRGPLRP